MFRKPKASDITNSLQRFADAQRDSSSRAKHFKIAFEGLPISEKRQIIEDYHFEAIHLVDSLVLHQENSSDIQAASDAESALWTLEQILCYGPEIVGKGWQWNAISTIIKRCLLPQNGSSLKRVAVRLFIMWYQILAVNNNVTPELDKVFQSLLPYFPLKNGENTEQILMSYCERPIDNSNNLPPNIVLSRKITPLFVPANMSEIQQLLQSNTKERAKQLQTWIDKFLEYICRETQKIEWGDQSKRFDCAKFLLDRMINLYILEVYPDLETNGVDIFGGWEGEPNTTDILDTADPIVIVRYWLIRWILNIASAKTVSNPSPSLLLFRSALFSNPRAINIMLSLLKESMCLPLACSTVTLRCMTLVKHWLTQKEIPPFLETGSVSLQSFSLLLIHIFSSFFNSPYIYASPEKINTTITISNFAIQIFRDMANSSNILPRPLPKNVWNELIKQLTNISVNVCKFNDSFSHSTSSAFTQALLVVTTFIYCIREIDIDDIIFDDIWVLFKTTVWSGTLDQWAKFVEILTKNVILNVFGIDPSHGYNGDDSDKSTSKRSYTRSDRSEKSDTGSNPDFPRSEADDIDDCQNTFDSSNNREMQSLVRSTGNPEKWLKLWIRIINMVDPSKAAFSQVAVQVLSQIIQMLIPINCANILIHHVAQRLLMVDIKAQPHAIPSLCSVLVTSSPPPLLRAHILIKLEDCLTTDIAPIVLEQVPSMKLEDIFILHKPIIESLQIIIKNGEISSKIVRVTSLLSLEQTDAEKLLLTILTQQHYMEMDLSTLALLVNALSILILERGDITLGKNLYQILLKNQSLSIQLTYLLIRNLDELKKRGKRNFLRQSLEQIINMLKIKDENIIRNELLWMLMTLICDGKKLPLNDNNSRGTFEKILSLLSNHDRGIKNSFLEGFLLTNTVFYPLPGFSLAQWNSIDNVTPIPGKTPNKIVDKDYENQVFIKNRGVLINVDKEIPSEFVVRTVVGKHVWSIKNVDEIDVNGKYHPHIKRWLKDLSTERMEQDKRTIKIEETTTHEINDNFFEKLPTFPKNYKDPIDYKPMLDFIKKSKRHPLSRPSTSDINKTTPSDDCCLVADNKEELGTWRQFVNDIQLIHHTCEIKSNFPRELRHLDTTLSREVHKIAVIYVGKGQEDKSTILSNTISDGSEEFMEFINSLGRIITIGENHYGYGGGLSIGHKAPYYADGSTEVIFHISTFLTGDVTQKTKHLGNDEVHVVWNENYKNYKRDTIATKFCDILIVLTPISPAMIRVSIETQKPLSFGPLFDGSFVSICEIGPMVRETALNASRAYKVDRINCDRPLKHRENVYKECLDKVGYAKMADAITNIYIPQLKN
uniref:Probable Rho GTPase-activating protein CG5521 (inferred by orthology to a D. melanogaster protein) n=1 Tax=Strongyloides venezuelensis TaxID=75913 RepID=A0A0K0G3E3_STRVS